MKTSICKIVSGGGLILAAAVLASTAIASEAEADRPVSLVAVLDPTEGSAVSGTVGFVDLGDGLIEVRAEIDGLEPGSKHGFHIHEYGDLTDKKGEAAGDHFNPEGHAHALPDKSMRHAGDLGNLTADASGHASHTVRMKSITLTTGTHAVLGRSIVVHASADDGSQPSGNAGPRIAVGVIGYQDPSFADRVKRAGDDRIAAKVGEAIIKAGKAVEEAVDEAEEKSDDE